MGIKELFKQTEEEIAEHERRALLNLETAAKCKDKEASHGSADGTLVKFIERLGFQEVADAYEAVDKWYA
jgi:hypothetical protein